MKTTMKKFCAECGKEFEPPYKPAPGRPVKFCSVDCYHKSRNGHIYAACKTCGKRIKVFRSKLHNHPTHNRYCSVACYQEQRRANRKPKNAPQRSKKRFNLTCGNCGKDFTVATWEMKADRKYCSKECFYKGRREIRSLRKCQHCGKEFQPVPTETRRNPAIFCSRRCHFEAKRVRHQCKTCGKFFQTTKSKADKGNFYCSAKCSGEAKRLIIMRKCSYCGRSLARKPCTNRKNVFCNKLCHDDWQREQSRIKLGDRMIYGADWRRQRQKALKRDDFRCKICGVRNNILVHHLIPLRVFRGDRERANALSNLLTVCAACHGRIEGKFFMEPIKEVNRG